MIKLEEADMWGWEHAIRGMRNPMNSWGKSDTSFCPFDRIGDDDLTLMKKLISAGVSHRKFLRQIFVSVDITAPLYWWKEFDTYKVGTVSNSCSTMHKIHAKEFTLDDFSKEHLCGLSISVLRDVINVMNFERQHYLDCKDKDCWWQMIQLLPNSYNQKRTITVSYENLLNMYGQRKNHKLDEWRDFCKWIIALPYMEEFICCLKTG